MTVRVEFGADRHFRPHDRAHARQDVSLAIIIALGDHRAVQPEHDHVDRHRCAQFVEDLVA
jgi:hypothetical protein